MRPVLERPEGRRQEVLVRVARGQDQAAEALGVVRGHELADGAPGVVADQGHAVEVQRVEEVGDEPGDAGWREIRVGLHRDPVGAERKVGNDAAMLALQRRGHLPPESAVDEQAVDEHDRLARAGVPVADRALGKADLACPPLVAVMEPPRWSTIVDDSLRGGVSAGGDLAGPPLTSVAMKAGIHPEYVLAHVRCSCGNEFYTRSTKPELHVEICSACHPFYTGKQKLVDTGGRVERFKRRAARSRR